MRAVYRWLRDRPAVLGFAILFAFALVAAVELDNRQVETERLARGVVQANREGCERVNVLRENQAGLIAEQVRQTERSLRGSLNGLERFRTQIIEGLRLRKTRLRRLRVSVRDHRTRGQPFRVNCEEAYPDRPLPESAQLKRPPYPPAPPDPALRP